MKIAIQVLRKSDPWLLVSTVALLSIGVLMVFSTTALLSEDQVGSSMAMVSRHFMHLTLAIVVFIVVLSLDIDLLKKHSVSLLFISLFLLILVLIPGLGKTAGGAQRWLGFGPVRIQPGEFVKIFVIIFMAAYIDRYKSIMSHFVPGIIIPFSLLGGVGLLFLLQPDLGSVVVIVLVVIAELFTAAKLGHLFLLGGVACGLFAIAVSISPYRMKRVKAFLDPFADPAASGYQLIQSLIAVGSGGLFGVGIGGSKQKLNYLPAAHTDFIYAVIAEEMGLIGALIVMSTFVLVVYRGFRVAYHHAHDAFRSTLAVGCTALIGIPALLNIAVVLGLLPTKGMVLPFISYGGTALVVYMAAMAILMRLSSEGVEDVKS